MSTRKVRLEIAGSSYVVATNDSEEYLLSLAQRLDEDMNRLMVETPNASVAAAAVITALGYLDEAEKSALGADNMRAQIQDYLEDAAKSRMEAEDARRDVERLRRELAYYEKQQGKKQNAPAPQPAKEAPSTGATKAAEPSPEEFVPLQGQIGIDEL